MQIRFDMHYTAVGVDSQFVKWLRWSKNGVIVEHAYRRRNVHSLLWISDELVR